MRGEGVEEDCTEGGKKWLLQNRGRGLVERTASHSRDSRSGLT